MRSPPTKPRVVSDIGLSHNDRKSVLIQAVTGLQSLSNLAALAPFPGLSICLPIIISIVQSIDVSLSLRWHVCTLLMYFGGQGANSNQEECLRLAERATDIFCAIVNQTADRKDPASIGLNQALDKLAV
jgi:hypothetical protein